MNVGDVRLTATALPDSTTKIHSTNIMKAISLFSGLFLAVGSITAQAQTTYVTQSQVFLSASISTQGTSTTTTATNGSTVVTQHLNTVRFGNNEVLAAMISSSLITGKPSDWQLMYLVDSTGNAGFYAQKTGVAPVAVPTTLLTLPVNAVTLNGGSTSTSSTGTVTPNTTAYSFSSITVNGISASGLSSTQTSTFKDHHSSTATSVPTTTTEFSFSGDVATPTATIIQGSLSIGFGRLSQLSELPGQH